MMIKVVFTVAATLLVAMIAASIVGTVVTVSVVDQFDDILSVLDNVVVE